MRGAMTERDSTERGGMMRAPSSEALIRLLYDELHEIARRERIPPYRAAARLAEERIAAVGSLDRMWMGGDGERR